MRARIAEAQAGDGDSTTTPPKKYLIPTAGVEKQSEDGRYSANGYNVYCNLDALTATLKRVFSKQGDSGTAYDIQRKTV